MKDNFKIIKSMDLEDGFTLMVIIMKENGKMMRDMDRENGYMLMKRKWMKKDYGNKVNFKNELLEQ
jgi:hypothetical protein